jgi:hypothetical protein
MSSVFFAAQPAAHAVSRGLIGAGPHDPVVTAERGPRAPRTRRVVARSLHRLADSVSGS